MTSKDADDFRIEEAVATLMRSCLDTYRTNLKSPHTGPKPFDDEMRATLISLLDGMASLHDMAYRGQGWRADPVHAGYLLKTDQGRSMRVPYHVLPTFPTGADLHALFDVSRSVRSANNSVICISGSNVLRRVFDIVNDVDFCEYLDVTQKNAFDNLPTNLAGGDDLVCLHVKLDGYDWDYPWDDANPPTKEIIASALDSTNANRATIKFDYAGAVPNFGAASISNIVIATDAQGRSEGLSKTFAAQEAPLVPSNWIPNAMASPEEMGRYVDWLVAMVEFHIKEDKMPKALKRAASLSRVAFQTDITNRITILARRTTVYIDQKLADLKELKTTLKPLTDTRSRALLKSISKQEGALRAERAQRATSKAGQPAAFEASARKIAVDLLNRIDKRAAQAIA